IRDQRSDHRSCLLVIVHGPVVESTMRLDMAHSGTGDTSEAIERPDLIDHVIGQTLRVDINAAAAESGEIVVADLGTDGHTAADGCFAYSTQGVGGAGMEAAGDIGAGDDVQQRLVITQLPDAESLAEIAIEVDDGRGMWLTHWAAHGWSAGAGGVVLFLLYL